MADATALVIENAASDPVARLGDWLRSAGLTLQVVRPYAGDPLPDTLEGFSALVVMGGPQRLRGHGGQDSDPYLETERRLLRLAGAERVPTLAICLGAQLLAQAYGGTVGPAAAGPELGPRLVAKRDVAATDPLFAEVPFTPDVMQWHFDEITQLPAGATLLASSPRYQVQAYRMGTRTWATQFHIECDVDMVRAWAAKDAATLVELGRDPDEVAEAGIAVLDDIEEVWRPFAERFAALAQGRLDTDLEHDPAANPLRQLPVIGD